MMSGTKRAHRIEDVRPGWLATINGRELVAEDVFLTHTINTGYTKSKGPTTPVAALLISITARSISSGQLEVVTLAGELGRVTTLWQPPVPVRMPSMPLRRKSR